MWDMGQQNFPFLPLKILNGITPEGSSSPAYSVRMTMITGIILLRTVNPAHKLTGQGTLPFLVFRILYV